MTITQKISDRLIRNAEKVEAGELIKVKTDLVLGNDITSPVAIKTNLKNTDLIKFLIMKKSLWLWTISPQIKI